MAGMRGIVAVAIAVGVIAADASRTLAAQDSSASQPASAPSTSSDTAAGRGPAFFTIHGSDRKHTDMSDAPVLQRRISLTLIGIPLGMAVQAIGDRAGLETTFSPETLPLGARVTMHADDVTVAAALRWALVNARVDVLLQNDDHLTLVPKVPPAVLQDSSGVVTGELVDGETGEPVSYGTVTLLGTEVARFADHDGHFRMARLPVQRYVVRARQIGYAPVDSTVAVARDSTTLLTIRMHRIPAMLRLVRVTGRRPKGCVATGIPDSTVDPVLAAVFAQIRENVDRYDLLLKEYPFRSTHVERQVRRWPRGGDVVEFIDTIAYEPRERRPYRVGGLLYHELVMRQDSVFRDHPVPGGNTHAFVGMRSEVVARRRKLGLPTFADLADPAFLAAHCFEYGGTTRRKGSADLVRVNFEPAKSIKTPDVSGSVYLDADSLVLRRIVFEVTKPKAAEPPVLGFKVTATFREILPLVPVVDSFASEQSLGLGQTALGSDRMIGFAFDGLTPGEEVGTPPERATVPSAPRRDTALATPATTLVADVGDTRVRAVFPPDSSCRPTPAVDTISLILYATVHGRRPQRLSDAAWSTYTNGVLSALSQSFALPDTLSLSTFSWPFEHAVRKESRDLDTTTAAGAGAAVRTDTSRKARVAARLAVVEVQGRNIGPFVVPMISTADSLTLGADGSLRGVRLTASSTSRTGDSLVLAAVQRAAGAHAFPRLEGKSDDRDSVSAELIVSIAEPAPGDQVVALGRLDAPAWPSVSGVQPVEIPSLPAALLQGFSKPGPAGDTAALEFVVNDRGQALPATARLEYPGGYPRFADKRERYARRLVSVLGKFRYEAGRIAGCRVPEFTRESFRYEQRLRQPKS
jgi:hypothetical protein